MEKKTIEEIRKTVLAYCEELTANWSVGVQVDIENLPNAYVSRRWSNGVFDAHFLGFSIAVDRDTKDSEFALIYRLLGLETRDAVETEREEMMKTVDAMSAMVSVDPIAFAELEARNTALVEALEKAKGYIKASLPNTIITGCKEENYYFAYRQLNEALAANTEKGGANGN